MRLISTVSPLQMTSITLRLISADGSEQEDVTLSFETEDLVALTGYVANCDRFATAKIFRDRFPSIEKILWTTENGLEINVSEFDYALVYELLHLARPIFLRQEPSSFERVKAIFSRKGRGTAMVRHIKALQDVYDRGDYQPYFQLSVGGTPLFHDRTVNNWLNGAEYHQDQDKARIIQALEASLTSEVARGVFVAQLSGRIRATFMLAELSKMVVGKCEKNTAGHDRR